MGIHDSPLPRVMGINTKSTRSVPDLQCGGKAKRLASAHFFYHFIYSSFMPMIFLAIFFLASKFVRTEIMNRWVWGAPAPCQVPAP